MRARTVLRSSAFASLLVFASTALVAAGFGASDELPLIDASMRGSPAADGLGRAAALLVRAGASLSNANEYGIRAVFLLVALASVAALGWAVRRVLGERVALWTVVAFSTLPMATGSVLHPGRGSVAQAATGVLVALAVLSCVGPRSALTTAGLWCCRAGLVAFAYAATTFGGRALDVGSALEGLAHRAFPWTGLAVLAVCSLWQRAEDPTEGRVRRELSFALVAGFVAHALGGTEATASLSAGPLALALAMRLARGWCSPSEGVLVAFATAVVARDLALYPTLLRTLGGVQGSAESLRTVLRPELARWSLFALAACAPALALAVFRSRRALVATPIGALVTTLCLAHGLEARLAAERSPAAAWAGLRTRHASYEPVASLDPHGPAPSLLYAPASLSTLANPDEAARWLDEAGPARRWLVLAGSELAPLNAAWRQRAGRNLPVLAGDASGWLLASSDAGEIPSENPLDRVISAEPLAPLAGTARAHSEGADLVLHRFGQELELRAVDVSRAPVTRLRASTELALHVRVLRPITADWTVFTHVDGPCPRGNFDHAPARGAYPTSLWRAGEHVRDAFTVTVPWYCPRGSYAVYVGFFRSDTRMHVTVGPHDGADRVLAATLRVE